VVSYGVRVVVMAGCECRDTSSPFHHAYTSANEVMFVCSSVCLSAGVLKKARIKFHDIFRLRDKKRLDFGCCRSNSGNFYSIHVNCHV